MAEDFTVIEDGTVPTGQIWQDNFNTVCALLSDSILQEVSATYSRGNVRVDLFSTESSSEYNNMEYDSANGWFETCNANQWTTSSAYYIVIVTSSGALQGDWNINNCTLTQIGKNIGGVTNSNIYVLWSDNEATQAGNKGNVWQTCLDRDQTGGARLEGSTYGANNISNIYSKDANDTDKRPYFAGISLSSSGDDTATGTWTFSDTTNNTNPVAWGRGSSSSNGITSATFGSTSIGSSGGGSWDNTTTGVSEDNPATMVVSANEATGGVSVETFAWCLCEGGASFSSSTTNTNATTTSRDFFTEDSIPLIEDGSSYDFNTCYFITNAITIESQNQNCFIHPEYNLSGNDTLSLQVSFDGGSNYTTILLDEWTLIQNTGTSWKVRFNINRDAVANNSYVTSYVGFISN